MADLQDKIFFQKAIEWRFQKESRLKNPREIGRYFAGKFDGLEGVIVDSFGSLVVLTVYNLEFSSRAHGMILILKDLLGPERYVIGKIRRSEGGFEFRDPENVLGLKWTASEDGALYEVRADDKNDFGIFADARPARLTLRDIVTPESCVLNLFSYTCGFGVVALRAGAKNVINVDANPEMLTWGKTNAELNGVDFAVIPELVQKYLTRMERRISEGKMNTPDVWVCDPPAFGVGRGPQRLLRLFWADFWGQVERLRPEKVLLLRNDRTGHRSENTLSSEAKASVGHCYNIHPLNFAGSPSLCYESDDKFYKFNESLLLLRR